MPLLTRSTGSPRPVRRVLATMGDAVRRTLGATSRAAAGALAAARATLAVTPRHLLVAVVCAVAALVAATLALATDQPAHRIWGLLATAGYLGGAVTALRSGRVVAGLRVAVAGAVALPTAVLVVTRMAQPEVGVVERSARTLLETGSPYLEHPVTVDGVNPYLPGMSLFGLPSLAPSLGGLGDARWWFLAAFVGTLIVAERVARGGPGTEALLWAVLAFPAVAVQVAVAGHDLPVVGLLCLSLALAARGRATVAGLALGVACSLKASAWPAVAVIGVLVLMRSDWRRAARFAAVALAVTAAAVLPVLLGPTGGAMMEQVAGFPMRAGAILSPASAPTPGVLLAAGGPQARLIGYALLALAVGACAGWLVMRPPRTAARAAWMLALALTAAALVLPTSRAGYVLYPVVLAAVAVRWQSPAPAGRWPAPDVRDRALEPTGSARPRSGDGGI